jgi:site-specific recombinase XerD
MSTAVLVTVFVRHTPKCKHGADELYKKCDCRKHLRWSANGTQHRTSADTRDWLEAEKAKRNIEDQLSGKPVAVAAAAPKSIEDAVTAFIQHKTVEAVNPHLVQTYRRELRRFRDFVEGHGVYTVQGVTRETVTGYAATWPVVYASSNTRVKVKERLSGFFTFCYESRWIDRKPKLPKIAVDEPPTMPLTDKEYADLLKAVPVAVTDERAAVRARGLILLMRWTGLAIRDAITLERSGIMQGADGLYRVTTSRQKTGTDVCVPLPPAVALEVLAVPNDNEKYVFWDGKNGELFSAWWGTHFVAPVFDAAKIEDVCFMKSHRLRDTFAVDLLTKGVPMEEVSKLLGHESIRTTEKHYAKWVKGRQDRLDSLVTGTWDAT